MVKILDTNGTIVNPNIHISHYQMFILKFLSVWNGYENGWKLTKLGAVDEIREDLMRPRFCWPKTYPATESFEFLRICFGLDGLTWNSEFGNPTTQGMESLLGLDKNLDKNHNFEILRVLHLYVRCLSKVWKCKWRFK